MTDLPAPTELVQAAMATLGATTDDDLRDELRRRYGLAPSQGTINRWRNGKRERGPSYEYALALLDIAGWLNRDAARLAASEGPADPLEDIATTAVALTKGQAKVLAEIRDLRAALEDGLAQRRARPRRKTAG